MTKLRECTPGPYEFDGEIEWINQPGEQEIHSGNYDVYTEDGEIIVANVNGQISEGIANAALFAATHDHTLIWWAVYFGGWRLVWLKSRVWTLSSPEGDRFGMGSNAFMYPILTPELRKMLQAEMMEAVMMEARDEG